MSAIRRLRKDDLVDRLERARRQPSRSVFLTRAVRGLVDLAERSSPGWLLKAAAAPSDYDVLLRALQAPGVVERDVAARLVIQGFQERDRLLKAEGGVLPVDTVAGHLRITRQAVDKRRRAGTLLALPTGRRGFAYPAWQLGPQGTLPGLERVLKALRHHDPWMKCVFLLNPNGELGEESPLVALRAGRLDEVLRLAEAFGEQGAL